MSDNDPGGTYYLQDDIPDPILTTIQIEFPDLPDPHLLDNMTPQEVLLGESLLTPGLQTTIKVQSDIFRLIEGEKIKNLDDFKGGRVILKMERPILEKYGYPTKMTVDQITVRLDNRKLVNNNIEEFTLRAIDQSLLNDAENLVSKDWHCKTPSFVTEHVLRECAGVTKLEVEESSPQRDYIAENIHPFQVVAQQAQAALADGGKDPSFVHYMTYENLGTHHFKSLFKLTKQEPIIKLRFMETYDKMGYRDPRSIMTHSFPCDFDLLSDVLNGINSKGQNISTGLTFNLARKMVNMFGSQRSKCGGIGQGIPKISTSNEGSAKQQEVCPDYSKTYLQLRQARMALLDQDKIALRVTVPWNPIYHAGKIIEIELHNKQNPEKLNYGSGKYLIVSLLHTIKRGGFSTITMDCVAETVGQGGIV